ncbi:MAG: D-alanyl-D-alanine carboxypeptidase family protein [Bacilli bacterium]|jgi:D-alanyl-D-alanine carboxypeptidase|uniref:D-alanyl-D-alanine carboxypeptidase family protein n=1 Tax=Ureibacillus suwonensis TaxID=313007 RepID=A0ABW0RE44_9BACL|nr:D-alanyl-D-alanine carboxypeptidase [Bacilli bacterium]
MKNNKKNYILIGSLLVAVVAIVAIILAVNMNRDANESLKDEEENVAVSPEEKENEADKEEPQEEKDKSGELQEEATPSKEEPQEQPQVKQPEQQQPKTEQQQKEQGTKGNNGYIEGQQLPTKPTYIQGVLIANKKYPLPKDFAPGENKEARAAFEKMAQDAKKQGFELVAFSTYRSYEYQATLYNNYVARDGKEKADRYSARPGYSEHQTGLAFDIGEKGREDLWLEEAFGESPAGKWLAENAHKYGFILRYPKGKEHITGYMYEAWHFRYLGVELATKVKDSGLTLEEYLGIN